MNRSLVVFVINTSILQAQFISNTKRFQDLARLVLVALEKRIPVVPTKNHLTQLRNSPLKILQKLKDFQGQEVNSLTSIGAK